MKNVGKARRVSPNPCGASEGLRAEHAPLGQRRTLKVDVDQARPWTVAKLVGQLARANRRLVALGQSRSPSGKGWHLWIIVEPAPATAVETVALQLLLGSDPHREAYNLNRARRVDAGEIRPPFDRTWNVFYREAVGCGVE